MPGNRLPIPERADTPRDIAPERSIWMQGLELLFAVCVLTILGAVMLVAVKYLLMLLAQLVLLLGIVFLLVSGIAQSGGGR